MKTRLEHLLSTARADLEEAQRENRDLLEAARSKRTKKKARNRNGGKGRSPSVNSRYLSPTSTPTMTPGAPADSNRRPQGREGSLASARKPSVAVGRGGSPSASRRFSTANVTGEEATSWTSSNRNRVGSEAQNSSAPISEGLMEAAVSEFTPVPGGEERKVARAHAGALKKEQTVPPDNPTGGHTEEQQGPVAEATTTVGKGGGGGGGDGGNDVNGKRRQSLSPSALIASKETTVIPRTTTTTSPPRAGDSSSSGGERQEWRIGEREGPCGEGEGEDGGGEDRGMSRQVYRSGESGQRHQTSAEGRSQHQSSSEVSKHPALDRTGRRATRVEFSPGTPSRSREEFPVTPETLGGKTRPSSMPVEKKLKEWKRGDAVSTVGSDGETCSELGDRASQVLNVCCLGYWWWVCCPWHCSGRISVFIGIGIGVEVGVGCVHAVYYDVSFNEQLSAPSFTSSIRLLFTRLQFVTTVTNCCFSFSRI